MTRPLHLPLVDVIVLTWNDGPVLDAAVASALRSTDVDVAVWIVDNGSEAPVPEPEDPRVHLVRNATNLGVAPARRQGVALGRAPFVCFLDSDARLEPECIRQLLAATTLGVGLAAPVFTGQRPEASAGHAPTLLRKAARASGLVSHYAPTRRPAAARDWDVDFAIGACQLFRREVYDLVGGLDGSIFYGPEDVDFCLRLRARGWRVVQVGSAHCVHPARRRNRRLFSRSGAAHARAVLRHLRRHRGTRPGVGVPVTAGRPA